MVLPVLQLRRLLGFWKEKRQPENISND